MHDQNEMQSHREAMAGAMAFPGAPDDVAKILRQIGDSVAHNPGRLQRLAPRFDMGGREVGLSVVHPGGSSVAWRCPLLDVSPGGAAMLYPGFLHLHTRCMVHLAALGGKPLAISGRLAWCRFATGMVHVVGLAWDEELDVRQIVPQREWIEQVAKGDQHLNAELTGTMLAVGFDKLESGLLRIFTAGTRLRLRNVPDAGAALDLARAEAMDAILVDADNDSIDHADLSNRLRDMGLREPILLASSKPSAIAPQADGVEVVAKPLSRESLHVAIRDQMLANATPVAGSKPIHSDMPQLAEIGELAEAVSEYLALARDTADTLRQAAKTDDAHAALSACQSLRNTGAGFGFAVLADVAADAVTALNASGSATEAAGAIQLVVRVVDRLVDPTDPAADTAA